jgi:hypothetical protein
MGMEVRLETPHGDRLWVTARASSGPTAYPVGDDLQNAHLPTVEELQHSGMNRDEVRDLLRAAYESAETVPAELSITFNYGHRLSDLADDGLISQESAGIFANLYRRSAGSLLPTILTAINELNILNEPEDPNYWKPTAGNIVQTLHVLEGWALEHPDGVFDTF